jgi:hypothetical protein
LRDIDDPDRADVEDGALAICDACPALTACQAWFDGLPARLRPTGVVAGQVRRPSAPRLRGRPRKTAVA